MVDKPLRLFQNDYITSSKLEKIIFFCSNFEYFFKLLAPKATGAKSGGDESGGAEKSCSLQPITALRTTKQLNA